MFISRRVRLGWRSGFGHFGLAAHFKEALGGGQGFQPLEPAPFVEAKLLVDFSHFPEFRGDGRIVERQPVVHPGSFVLRGVTSGG